MQGPQTPQPYMSSQVNIKEAKIAHCTKWTCLKVHSMWGEMIWGKCIRNIMQISRLIKLLRGEEMYHSSVVHHIRLLPAWFSPGDEFADSGATDELGQKCNQMGMSAPDRLCTKEPQLFINQLLQLLTLEPYFLGFEKLGNASKIKGPCYPLYIQLQW